MRLTTIFLLAACVGVSAKGFSQTITYSGRNVPLTTVLSVIEHQTGHVFFYNDAALSDAHPVTVQLNHVKLPKALKEILHNQNLQYNIEGKTIFLQKMINTAMPIPRQVRVEKPSIEVHGTVKDSATGEPLVGVTIQVKGEKRGTTTDANGAFNLEVEDNAILVISYLGYKAKEISISGNTDINISLAAIATGLNQLVVVGYGTQKKGDITGAITSLGAGDLNSGGTVSNVAQALRGRVAGAHITQNSSAPGGSISIRIRGSNSISSGNEPLYVVDGFPTQYGLNINPDDIANIEILKDASATAIYGSRGANGVVLITTKRGQLGSEITYNAQVGIQQIKSPFQMLQGTQYMEVANALYKEIPGNENNEFGVFAPSDFDSKVNTDWIKETMRLGVVQDHSLQISSGKKNTKLFTSLGYFDQKGVLKNTYWSRFSGLVNVEQKINKIINMGASINFRRESSNVQEYEGNIANTSVLYMILNYSPISRVYNDDGTFSRPHGGQGDNPLANLLARTNEIQTDVFKANLFLEASLLDHLKIRVNGGSNIRSFIMGTYLPKSTYAGSLEGGKASLVNASANHSLLNTFITYEDEILNNQSVKIMGGYSWEKFYGQYRTMNGSGFSSDIFKYHNMGAASKISGISSTKNENYLISFFGRLNYSAFDKYLLTFNIRRDGSSRFGGDNRWGIFPSGAVAWQLGKEPFIKKLNFISHLKLRFGFGVTGNQGIGDYAYYGLVSTTNFTFDGTDFSSGTVPNPGTPSNPMLKWESTTQYDLGLDAEFFDSRLQFTMDLYHKNTMDLLINTPLPHYSGFVSGLKNSGTIENKGIEFNIISHNIVSEFTWNTGLVFSLNRNKVLNVGLENPIFIQSNKPIGSVSNRDFSIIEQGYPLGSLYGYVYEGVIQQGEHYAAQPNSQPGDPKFKDISGPDGIPDGQITSDDRTVIGEANPKFSFGISNSFSYKNFSLVIFAYGSKGNELLNMTRMNLEWRRTKRALNRWTPENTKTDIPRNGFFSSRYGDYINSYFIEDASFLRIESINLGYDIHPNRVFKSLRIFINVQNLFVLTKYSGWDPEVSTKSYENDPLSGGQYIGESKGTSSVSSNAGLGLDFNSYPTPKVFTLGLKVTF